MTGGQRTQFEHGMDAAALLRAQLQEIHRELDEGLTAFLRGLAPAPPPQGANPLRLYIHAATVEDVTIQSLLRQVAPVYETDWPGQGPARYSTADLAPVRAYAQQVFATTDAYLAGLGPDAASQRVDLSRLGQGMPTIAWVVSKFVVLQLAQICGELTSAVQQHR
ncbi:MAG TPA: hypothetical protein VKV73_28430 [Chloroflexota bacterium]|nr:hypothetical protein [Chloroflexota bacterium]